MEFDPTQPIWVQLVAEFSRRIVVEQWPPGARIPGVRDLAADLGVNPNTVQRALAELERDELCRTERANGRFVTDDLPRLAAARRDMAAQSADDYIARAAGHGMSRDEAIGLIAERWRDDNPDEHTSERS